MKDLNRIDTPVGRPGFSIRIAGPRVGEARISANDLATIILRTQQTLKRVGQVLYGELSVGRGRKKKEIEASCELFIVDWKGGSAIAEVELAEPPAQMSLLGDVGEESLKAFLNGMTRIQDEPPETLQTLPTGFDAGVLQTCDFLGQVLDHGVDTLTFQPLRLNALPSVTFDRSLREKLRGLLGTPLNQCQVEKIGRLKVLDGHRGVQGRLWEPDGTKWLCIFKPEHLELLPEAWLHTVRVVGEAVVEPNREPVLNVVSIVLLEEEPERSAIGGEMQHLSFWTSLPLEKLAELQGVQPADDLDQISALWPTVDDDPDQMLTYILEGRAARGGRNREERD